MMSGWHSFNFVFNPKYSLVKMKNIDLHSHMLHVLISSSDTPQHDPNDDDLMNKEIECTVCSKLSSDLKVVFFFFFLIFQN